MSLRDWLVKFTALHGQAKAGSLDKAQLERYQRAREELATALLSAQQLQLQMGQTARSSLRVQRTLQLDLQTSEGTQRSMTLDLSMGGFSTMLGSKPPQGERVTATLRMPEGDPQLTVDAVVAGVMRRGGTYRVSFMFHNLSDSALQQIGFLVFDTVLEALKG